MLKKVFLILVVLFLIVAGFVVYNVVSYRSATKGSPNGSQLKFSVPPGASVSSLGPDLQRAGVIDSTTDFKIYLRLNSTSVSLQQGEYDLRQHMPYAELISALAKGPTVVYEKVTIPEGLTVTQTAAKVEQTTHISAADFQAAATTATVSPDSPEPVAQTLEGYLYPQTYFVDPKETAQGLVRRMVSQFKAQTAGLSFTSPPAGVTPYQALVVASLVQKEAKAQSDGPLIAAVIYNRFKAHMMLGIDASTYYAVDKAFGTPLRQSDLDFKSPYNTRAVAGIPPTPIANPQLSSIQAALQPASSGDLYFVLSADCVHHSFFKTAAEFGQAAAHQPKC